MKKPFHSHTASATVLTLISALLAGSAISQSTTAAMLAPKEGEAAGPKEWHADPTKHQFVIKRETTDEKQSAMITAAEAAPVPKDDLHKAALEEADQPKLPQDDKVWWYQEKFGIRIPYGITGDAITYYSEVVANNAKKAFKSYAEPSSRLDYHASVKFHKEVTLDGKTFKDVNVVTLKLNFNADFTASATADLRFEKARVVVLDGANKVIHICGDGPTETKMRITAKPVVEDLLKALASRAVPLSPINWQDSVQIAHGELASAVFNGPFKDDLKVVNSKLRYPAIRAVSTNADGMARATLEDFFQTQLTQEDAIALAPVILAAIEDPSPADTMFNNGIRMAGLKVLAKYHFTVEDVIRPIERATTQAELRRIKR